ncbi:GYF domain-containing protein [Pendulispora albinea]|uniref:GYF domain-containing protein n=1 Tax=Pendulispora albinea TaxID=2741071 RepID=A0ABZ2M4J4_9BACT
MEGPSQAGHLAPAAGSGAHPAAAADPAPTVRADSARMAAQLAAHSGAHPTQATPRPASSRPGTAPRPIDGSNSKGGALTGLAAAKKPAVPRAVITPPPTPSEASLGSGALAGAFQKSIAKDDPALRDITGLREWYVAINGVPVGPVRIAELRRKASLGAVTEDSLVWQEGMEEWRPVKAYSELLALVREAAQSGRPPLAVTGDVRQSTPPPPKGYAPRPVTGSGTGVSRPVTGRSNVLPFAPRNAAAEKLEDPEATEFSANALPQQTLRTSPVPPEAVDGGVDPFALPIVTADSPADASFSDPFRPGTPGPGMARAPLSVQISPASGSVISPFAAGSTSSTAPSFTTTAAASGDRSSVSLGPPMLATEEPAQKKGPPWIPIAMVALAAAFGITAAIVIFRQPQQTPAAQPTAQAATPPPAASTPPAPPPSASADIELPETTTPPSAVADNKPAPSSPKPTTTPPKPPPASTGGKVADLGDLIRGSSTGPSTTSGPTNQPGGGASLSEEQIRAVMNQHSAGVRRNCWERGQAQQSVVSVTVHMTINGQGQVTSASSDGNEPAIAKCIETSVRSWQFPATGGPSTVNIPFKFVRQ